MHGSKPHWKHVPGAKNSYLAPSLRPLTAEIILEYWGKFASQLFPSLIAKHMFNSGVWIHTRTFSLLFGYPHVLIHKLLKG